MKLQNRTKQKRRKHSGGFVYFCGCIISPAASANKAHERVFRGNSLHVSSCNRGTCASTAQWKLQHTENTCLSPADLCNKTQQLTFWGKKIIFSDARPESRKQRTVATHRWCWGTNQTLTKETLLHPQSGQREMIQSGLASDAPLQSLDRSLSLDVFNSFCETVRGILKRETLLKRTLAIIFLYLTR